MIWLRCTYQTWSGRTYPGSKILSVVDLIFSCLLTLFDQICRHFVDRAGRSNWRDRWCFIEDVAQLDGGSSEADGIPCFPAQVC